MEAEWRLIGARSTSSMSDWEQQFASVAAEEENLRTEGLWAHGRDDLLGVLGRQRDELTHSRMIAWLLDPCAHHGLGTRVLAGILAMSFHSDPPASAALALAKPRCEVTLIDGRLDIVVEAPGLYLVIENKVDAPEGDRQCEHYYQNIQRPDARFVLLSPEGKGAQSESDDVRSAFRPLRYASLADIIRDALASAPAQGRARPVVEQYLRTLQREFPA
jgi:hypothetical protein